MRWYTQEEIEQWRQASGADKSQLPDDCSGLWCPDIGAWVRETAGIGKIDDRDGNNVDVFFPLTRAIESCPIQALQPLRAPNDPQFVVGDRVVNSGGEFLVLSVDNRSSYLGFIPFLEDDQGQFHNSQNCALLAPLELTQPMPADATTPIPPLPGNAVPMTGQQLELLTPDSGPQQGCPRCGRPPTDPDAAADRFCRNCGDFFAYLREV